MHSHHPCSCVNRMTAKECLSNALKVGVAAAAVMPRHKLGIDQQRATQLARKFYARLARYAHKLVSTRRAIEDKVLLSASSIFPYKPTNKSCKTHSSGILERKYMLSRSKGKRQGKQEAGFESQGFCRDAMQDEAEARIGPVNIRGLGLATQRETTVVWSKVQGYTLLVLGSQGMLVFLPSNVPGHNLCLLAQLDGPCTMRGEWCMVPLFCRQGVVVVVHTGPAWCPSNVVVKHDNNMVIQHSTCCRCACRSPASPCIMQLCGSTAEPGIPLQGIVVSGSLNMQGTSVSQGLLSCKGSVCFRVSDHAGNQCASGFLIMQGISVLQGLLSCCTFHPGAPVAFVSVGAPHYGCVTNSVGNWHAEQGHVQDSLPS
eukprot:1156619-Pelagomonas_calceolata.AAC.14